MKSETIKKKSKLILTLTEKEVELLEELFGQFTFDTILRIFRAGDYADALDGKDSETGFEEGGFDKPYKKAFDDLYDRLYEFTEEEDNNE